MATTQGKKEFWTLEKRKNLEILLQEGWNRNRISEILQLSAFTLRTEIKRGTTAEEFSDRRYSKYSAARATITNAIEQIGLDSVELIINEGKKYVELEHK